MSKIGFTPDERQKMLGADWNVNDPSNLGYVKNRTHYTETVKTSIEGMEFVVLDGGNSSGAHDEIPLEVGQKWKVIYISYGGSTNWVGDPEGVDVQIHEVAGEPCVNAGGTVVVLKDSANANSSFMNNVNVQTVKIVGVSGTFTKTTVHRLDEKYIPGSVCPFKIKVVYSAKTEDATVSATINEVDQALSEGRDIIVECQQDNIPEAYRVLRLADVQSTPVGSQVVFTCAMSGVYICFRKQCPQLCLCWPTWDR